MFKNIKVFCVELEGTNLLEGVVYQIEKYMIEDDCILVKVYGYDDYYYESRFEKVEDVINMSLERNIEIKEAIRCFL